jgi:hypothetical protein
MVLDTPDIHDFNVSNLHTQKERLNIMELDRVGNEWMSLNRKLGGLKQQAKKKTFNNVEEFTSYMFEGLDRGSTIHSALKSWIQTDEGSEWLTGRFNKYYKDNLRKAEGK